MDITSSLNLHCISFSILKVLIPSLNQDDITGARLLKSRSHNKFPSIIITLKTQDLVRSIMSAKKSFNYLTTKNIDLSFLNSELISTLPDRKIFINESLSFNERAKYMSIKDAAKNMGFKYIWYCAGDFLVRWREHMRVFTVRSISDLMAIKLTIGTINSTPDNACSSNQLLHTADSEETDKP